MEHDETARDVKQPMTFVGTSDLSGIVRGKSFPTREWKWRAKRGVGWTPTNVQITCFDTIAESPFGALGDLALVPDPAARVTLEGGGDVFDFALGDIANLDGTAWPFCTRSLARRALDELHALCGATPVAAFEHEFQIADQPPRRGDSYGIKGYRDAKRWAAPYIDALAAAGLRPDTFMKEYGPGQYEITVKPAAGLAAPDQAVILRILTDEVLRRYGVRPTFSPILDPAGVGNGVHLHMSFVDDGGSPLTYDGTDPQGLSRLARHFLGGILAHLDEILALLAPSEISYLRLTPHRWSAAWNNLGYRDREAAVRICPVSAVDDDPIDRQLHFEVRTLDAAASPYLAFAALIFAGSQGIRDETEPGAPTEEDLSLLAPDDLAARGLRRLPQSLGDALARIGASTAVRRWFGDDFVDLYVAHKRGEMEALSGLDAAAKCDRYKEVY